jgi:DNA-binding MarR family transcriptional regulator
LDRTKKVINTLFVEVFNQILSIEAQSLREKGVTLSMTEVHVLEAVQKEDIKTMGNVAKKLRITLGTLTTSVNVLVKKGYIDRYRDPDDRRRVFLKLTKKAEPVMKIHDQFHEEMIHNVVAELNLTHDDVLINSLENLTEFFKNKY